MKRTKVVTVVLCLAVSGCSGYWEHTSTSMRESQLKCAAEKKSDDPSTWTLLVNCGEPVLPDDCLVSDEAARSPRCVAIAKAAMLRAGMEGAASGAIEGTTAAVSGAAAGEAAGKAAAAGSH